MFSFAEVRRFGYQLSNCNIQKLQALLEDLNSIPELTNPQKALKDIIEIELEKRNNKI